MNTWALLGAVLMSLQVLIVAGTNQTRYVLIRRLLRGYERLPPPNGPTVVELGIYILKIYVISETNMDYHLSMYVREQWTDARLQFNKSENGGNERLVMPLGIWNKLWLPDVFFVNEKEASFHAVTNENRLLYVYDDGVVWYVYRVTVKLECPMKLHLYPLDTQSCPMRFESFSYTTDTVVFKWLTEKPPVEFEVGGSDIPQMVLDRYELNDCTNESRNILNQSYPCLDVSFIVTRDLGYFLIQYNVPSAMLVILSWVSFWISVDAVVARITIGLMTVLTLTTMSTGSRDQLPRVSYVKAIDAWMSTCLVFAFASLIEFAVVNVWSRKEVHQKPTRAPSQKKPEEIPLQQVTNLNVPPSPGLVRRLSNSMHKKLTTHQQRAQAIDRISRRVFPLSFLAFNIVYWVSYTIR